MLKGLKAAENACHGMGVDDVEQTDKTSSAEGPGMMDVGSHNAGTEAG